jgi:hypothetical protein
MFLYQRLDSNWHMLYNLTIHNANGLRNSRVAQKISEQFWFYATDCAICQSAPYTVNQLHNTQCCATRLIMNGPLYYPGICLEGLSKTMKNLTQDNRGLRQDSKRTPLRYESRILPLHQPVQEWLHIKILAHLIWNCVPDPPPPPAILFLELYPWFHLEQ